MTIRLNEADIDPGEIAVKALAGEPLNLREIATIFNYFGWKTPTGQKWSPQLVDWKLNRAQAKLRDAAVADKLFI